MAEKTVKNNVEEVKEEEKPDIDITDGEKYRLWRMRLMLAGRIALGVGCAAAVGLIAYNLGKGTGRYDCLEEIYKNFPDVRDALTAIDPAFFTTVVV